MTEAKPVVFRTYTELKEALKNDRLKVGAFLGVQGKSKDNLDFYIGKELLEEICTCCMDMFYIGCCEIAILSDGIKIVSTRCS